MSKIKLNSKGFIFIEVLFLTLIVSFTALMIVNALESAVKSSNMSAIRTAAVYIANARMAEIEEYADSNKSLPPSTYTLMTDSDFTYDNFFGINGTVKFAVDTKITLVSANQGVAVVTVTWTVNGNNYGISNDDNNKETLTKNIWLLPST